VGSEDGYLYAVTQGTGQSGHLVWRKPADGQVNSSPNVKDGVVYVGSNDGNLFAFNAVTGRLLGKHQTGGQVMSSPAVAYGRVYVGTDADAVLALWKVAS